MSMRVGGRGGGGGWRKEKHPTPHTALNNEGLLGVWAICELGDGEVYAGKAQLLLWVEEFHWVIMAGLFPLNLTNQCEGTGRIFPERDLHENICNSQKTFCISLAALRAAACSTRTLHTPSLSHHATQFSSLAVEYYREEGGSTGESVWGENINKQPNRDGMVYGDTLERANRVEMKGSLGDKH